MHAKGSAPAVVSRSRANRLPRAQVRRVRLLGLACVVQVPEELPNPDSKRPPNRTGDPGAMGSNATGPKTLPQSLTNPRPSSTQPLSGSLVPLIGDHHPLPPGPFRRSMGIDQGRERPTPAGIAGRGSDVSPPSRRARLYEPPEHAATRDRLLTGT